MNDATLRNLQEEFRASREEKIRRYHGVWRPILDEYGLRNFGDVWNHVTHYKAADDGTHLAGQGRIGSLNVLVRKMAGLVSLRDPEFLVKSGNPWNDAVATVLEHAFEQNRRAVGWNRQGKKIVLESCLFGTGLAKVGYGSEFMYDEPAWSAAVPQAAKKLMSDRDKAMPYGLSTESTNFRVQEGMPMMVHVPTQDVFYNLGVRREEDIRRIYHRVRRPLTDVLHDSRYNNKAKGEVTLTRWGDVDGGWLYLDTYDQDTTFVECIECVDLPSRQYCVFMEHASTALRSWTPFPFPIQNPFKRLVPIPHPNDVWGIPYALLILGQAQAMNRLRGVIIEAISRDGKKIFIGNPDGLDEEERRRVELAKDGEFVWIKGFNPEQGSPFFPMEFGGARPEVLELVRFVERDQAWVSGLTDAARNDTSGTDETATAVAQRAEQQGLTVDEFVQENEEFQQELAVDMMKIMMSRWDSKKLIRVIGPDPNMYLWTTVELERILGTFTLEVVAGSSMKRDRATERKQFLELMPRLAELDDRIKADLQMQMQTGQPGFINWYEVARQMLDMFDTTLARKILRADNMVMLAMRLMDEHQESPLYMSPELERQVTAMAMRRKMGGMTDLSGQEGLAGMGVAQAGTPTGPGAAPSFEVRNGVPAPQAVSQASGGLFSETAGMAGRLN